MLHELLLTARDFRSAMALRAKVLQKKAEKFELKKLKVIELTKERVSLLDTLLEDVYTTSRPKPTDYEVRKELVCVFNDIAKDIYGKSKEIPVVVEFGSFVMDLFSTTSDLDLSVNFSSSADFPREKKIQTLRKFARKLYAIQSMGHVYGVLPITTAKVPILKCVDRGTGVECDISVENRDGISKSRIIGIISSIDERFKKLSFLLKIWARAHNVNSSRDKTLNSLSIILLVAFHLQTRNPPILPPFSAIFKDGNDPASVEKAMPNFVNYGKRNRESLAELFITLLLKLSSVEKLWPKGLCASTCTATWTSKTWDSKVASISVEDFSDRTQNVARAVGLPEVKQIYKCIDISIRNITAFMNGQIGLQLKDLLFGRDGKTTSIRRGIPKNLVAPFSQANQTRGKVTGKRKKRPMHPSFSFKSRKFWIGAENGEVETSSAKKMRTDDGCRRMPSENRTTVNVDSSQRCNRGWDEICAGVSERAKQASAGGWEQSEPSSAAGWEETQKPKSGKWGVSQKGWGGCAGGWERAKKATASGWEQSEPSSAGGWEETQTQKPKSGKWGVSQKGWGGCEGGWERAKQATANGLEQSEPSSAGGWEETHKPKSGKWGGCGGGWERAKQATASSWERAKPSSAGGWEDTQKPKTGGWGAMKKAGWEVGNEQRGGGGWGSWEATQQPNVGA